LLSPWLSRLGGDAGAVAWLLDLASHWQWLWLPLGLIGCLRLAGWRSRLALALAMLPLPWLALPPALPAGDGEPALRIASANLHLGNQDPRPLLGWLQERRVDLLVLVELNSVYADALRRQSTLPHWQLAPSDGTPWGLGLGSRWPLREVRLEHNADGIPLLRVRVEHPDGVFDVIAVHPMPPLSPSWHQRRQADFEALQVDGPALLAGDLNASPWSSAAWVLQRRGWRRASGVAPTWPSPVLGIAIDGVWAQGPWAVHERAVGPDIGSDHRPLYVGLGRGSGS